MVGTVTEETIICYSLLSPEKSNGYFASHYQALKKVTIILLLVNGGPKIVMIILLLIFFPQKK
jgi:hypothetical protein